jgi:hypothetical protein
MTTPQHKIGSGFGAFSVHPGGILTPLQGAATQTWCATSPQLDGMGGVYSEDCDIAEPAVENAALRAGVRDYAVDPEQAARLWALSAQLTGVDAFAAAA